MTDTNIQSEGECRDCADFERKIDTLNQEIDHIRSCSFHDACEIGELKKENERLGNIAHEVNRMMTEVAKLEQENKTLRDRIDKGTDVAIDRSITFERLVVSLEELEKENKELREALRFWITPIENKSFEEVQQMEAAAVETARKLLEP